MASNVCTRPDYEAAAAEGEDDLDTLNHDKPPEAICKQCSKFSFSQEYLESIILDAQKSSQPIELYMRPVAESVQLRPKMCRFCRFLEKVAHIYNVDDTMLHLNIQGAKLEERGSVVDGLLFTLAGEFGSAGWFTTTRSDGPNNTGLLTRAVDIAQVNWSQVSYWLRSCQKEHRGCTGTQTIEHLRGFSVIDCTTEVVVDAPPNCEYTALSYVWGLNSGTDDDASPGLPANPPRAIKDAIACTRSLGLRYLWVDRYCIDYKDNATKHMLIQCMDQIYRNSALTIIKATGNDSTSGLPGVSENRRRQIRIAHLGMEYTIVPALKTELLQSKWSSRGWCYQEGLLARRRLVFTELQVYFQCLETLTWEGISASFPTMDVMHTDNFTKARLAYNMQMFPPWTAQEAFVHSRINEYLGKNLTFDSDVLDAFSGILRYGWYHKPRVYSFWGLPFSSSIENGGTLELNFLFALLWYPRQHSDDQPILPRAEFPSWSIFGWKNLGPAYVENGYIFVRPRRRSVCFEDTDGVRISIKEYIHRMEVSWSLLPFKPRVIISGWFGNVKVGGRKDPYEIFDEFVFRGKRGDVDVTEVDDGMHSKNTTSVMETVSTLLLQAQWPSIYRGLVLSPVQGKTDVFSRPGLFALMKPAVLEENGSLLLRLRDKENSSYIQTEYKWRTITLV